MFCSESWISVTFSEIQVFVSTQEASMCPRINSDLKEAFSKGKLIDIQKGFHYEFKTTSRAVKDYFRTLSDRAKIDKSLYESAPETCLLADFLRDNFYLINFRPLPIIDVPHFKSLIDLLPFEILQKYEIAYTKSCALVLNEMGINRKNVSLTYKARVYKWLYCYALLSVNPELAQLFLSYDTGLFLSYFNYSIMKQALHNLEIIKRWFEAKISVYFGGVTDKFISSCLAKLQEFEQESTNQKNITSLNSDANEFTPCQ